jgi:hypothetical protein
VSTLPAQPLRIGSREGKWVLFELSPDLRATDHAAEPERSGDPPA